LHHLDSISFLEEQLKKFNKTLSELLTIKFHKQTLLQLSLVHHALTSTNTQAIIYGPPGSGKYTLTRFASFLLNIPFYSDISPQDVFQVSLFETKKLFIFIQ
jgi:SpoVK/Ycf46/Vps4 family AAA+-type ATPase